MLVVRVQTGNYVPPGVLRGPPQMLARGRTIFFKSIKNKLNHNIRTELILVVVYIIDSYIRLELRHYSIRTNRLCNVVHAETIIRLQYLPSAEDWLEKREGGCGKKKN